MFSSVMLLDRENPKDAAEKLLELINELGKVAGYKINAQKYLAFLYTNNERSEREIKETILFISTSKKIESGILSQLCFCQLCDTGQVNLPS